MSPVEGTRGFAQMIRLLALQALQQLPAGDEAMAALFINIQNGKQVLTQRRPDLFQSRRSSAFQWNGAPSPAVVAACPAQIGNNLLQDLTRAAIGMHRANR